MSNATEEGNCEICDCNPCVCDIEDSFMDYPDDEDPTDEDYEDEL